VRQVFRIIGVSFWSLLSLEILVGIIDWSARWTWVKELLDAHPYLAAFAHTPFVYLALLILGFFFLTAERKLKLPNIHARLINERIMPNLHTVTIDDLFKTERQTPGWDERKLDWWWFVEIQLANDSDTRTTIQTVGGRVTIGRHKGDISLFDNLGQFRIDMGIKADGTTNAEFSGQRHRNLTSLLQTIANEPLERGIGYRGWMRCEVKQISQKDMNSGRVKIHLWLIDALQGRHKVHRRKRREPDWDQSFLIFDSSN
jgi:hypothetical protein